MVEENIVQDFGLNEIDEKRNYFIEEMNQNELISKKQKGICKVLTYTEPLLILASTVTGCVSIFTFFSLVGIAAGIGSSAATINACVITAGIKKYNSTIIKKKRKNIDKTVSKKIVLLAKTKLNTIKVLTFKAFIDSKISHDEFVSENDMLKEYDDLKEEIKNSNNK